MVQPIPVCNVRDFIPLQWRGKCAVCHRRLSFEDFAGQRLVAVMGRPGEITAAACMEHVVNPATYLETVRIMAGMVARSTGGRG